MSDTGITCINDSLEAHLAGHKHPHLFCSPPWLELIHRQYGYDFFKVQQSPDEFIIAARIRQLGITKIKSLPFCDYIIPSVSDAQKLNRLVKHLKKAFPDEPIELKMVLPGGVEPGELNYQLSHTAYRHLVDTSGDINDIENNMDHSFMRGVRKARSHHLNVSIERSEEALDKFYEIYCRQRIEKFEKLPQPLTFFEKIRENFLSPQKGFILQAKKDAAIIASLMILEYKSELYYKFGCSLPQYLDHRPNNLLFHRLFAYACEQGFEQVGLGLSGVSDHYAGLVRFKEYMGGVPENIYRLRLEPAGYDNSAENELNAFTSSLTETIVGEKPDAPTADAFSEILYPYFA